MQLFFCENCNELTENDVCPKCGKQTREPQDNDMCFVCELDGINVDMYADALSNNEIAFVHVPSFSAKVNGVSALTGVNYCNTPASYKFYVKYADYTQANEIAEAIFAPTDESVRDEDWIDKLVKVIIDRPKGSVHPEHPDVVYGINYGHIEGVTGGDGEEQDAYILDWSKELSYAGKEVDGFVVAVIRRKNDVETKWVVGTDWKKKYTREEIEKAVDFQEKFFDIEIIM